MLSLLAGLVLATTIPDLSLKAPQVEQTALIPAVCAIKTPLSEGVVQAQCAVGALRKGDVVGVGFILESGDSIMFIGTEAGDGTLTVDSMVVSDSPYAAQGACGTRERAIMCVGAPVGMAEPVVIQAFY